MNRIRAAGWAVLGTLVFSGLAVARPDPGMRVNRCSGPQGETVFTDRPCDAEPLARTATPPDTGNSDTVRIELAAGCAPKVEDLAERLRRALETRDLNALAAVHDWTGAGAAEARWQLTRIRSLLDLPVTGWGIALSDTPPQADHPSTLSLTPLAPGATVHHFVLVERAGCWWLARG